MDFDIDPMLFLQTALDDQVEIALGLPEMGGMMFGVADEMFAGVAEIAHEKAAEAQAQLDALIEADETWKPVEFHWGHLLSGTITCDCGWESAHYVHAADAEVEFAQHLREVGVTE
jgi:hypothetical protein